MICPTCKRVFTAPAADPKTRPASTTRPPLPFCSPRCRAADLGNWLAGSYRITTPASEDELDRGPDREGESTN